MSAPPYLKFRAILLCVAAAFVLSSCSSGDAPEIQGDCPAVGNLVVTDLGSASGENRCQISGTLTVNAVLSNSVVWLLNGAVQIGNATSNPELFVSKGARVRGSTNGITPDYLYIVAGASIDARGDVDNPIIFSSNDDVDLSTAGGGKWGGLIIEDSIAFNSENKLEYVIIAEAGAEVTLNAKTYNSNLTLEGDHDNTTLRFVQSHDARGDGIRLEGVNGNLNTARMDWLIITGAGRDAISYQDFSGLIKDVLVIHRAGAFNETELSGGRAGIFASGEASLPLFTNITLMGNDDESVANPVAAQREMGIIFSDDPDVVNDETKIRLANTSITNFRHGCYEVESGANISAIDLAGPVTSFMGGVHCVNEVSTAAVKSVVRSGSSADDLTITGSGNGTGFRFHSSSTVFRGELSPSDKFTARWHIINISGFLNGVPLSPTALGAFNSGDTNNSGVVNSADVNARPFMNNADAFFSTVDGQLSIDGFRGYDLTHIGAVRTFDNTLDDSSAQFDGWTLQDGAITTVVGGFNPVNP